MILPKFHCITSAISDHFHRKFVHAGAQTLLAALRQRFWPIEGRKTVSAVIIKCTQFFKLKLKLVEHFVAPLRGDRVQPNRPLVIAGVDFFGPFYSKSEVRTRPPIKCYVAIFVCFATKATHLEVVEDLSTQSFVAALKRFISLRGKPRTIWSDNATNFVGAKNELIDLRQLFLSDPQPSELWSSLTSMEIKWNFIPPRSPRFGGLREAAVNSAKYHFARVVGKTVLTFQELRMLVCEISKMLNLRPLCPISENPDDIDVLTPAMSLCVTNAANILKKIEHRVPLVASGAEKMALPRAQRAARQHGPHRGGRLTPLRWRLGRVESTASEG
ncbi:uncharacterized protein LOC121529786 [Drosophila eugracilis]|uniref:uncharacterized protein LOC121529786 n=1 Tax=Drosophila eugracilis TaxID=29029 RepID=UPI001BD98F53|nr:uncharacterized protein LOC121529786 [Drosophila eugracilis]